MSLSLPPAKIVPLRIDGTLEDNLLVGDQSRPNVVYASYGDDTIVGGAMADLLVGEAGRDHIEAGDGNDTVYGGGADDTILGGAGADKLYGDGGNDRIDGGEGDDRIDGGVGNDVLLGGAGRDTLLGGAGNDHLDGGAGNDVMMGGAGDDTYVVDSLGDVIMELPGEGNDTVLLGVKADYTLYGEIENIIATYGGTFTGSDKANVMTAGLDETSTIKGGGGDDTITGSTVADSLYGGTGNDVISGGAGADLIKGESGDDRLDGGAGKDKLYGEAGNDIIDGGADDDHVNGGAGNDQLFGGVGRDGLYGGGGNDVIDGGDGNDTIYGDGGDDVIRGGAGSDVMAGGQQKGGFSLGRDTFVWQREDVLDADGKPNGHDRIVDFGVGDRLDFSGLFGAVAPDDRADLVRVVDGAKGTLVSADLGAGVVDIVTLDGVHGVDLDDLVGSGSLIV